MVRTSSWMTACQQRSLGVTLLGGALAILLCTACPACGWNKIRYCNLLVNKMPHMHPFWGTSIFGNTHMWTFQKQISSNFWHNECDMILLMVKLVRRFILYILQHISHELQFVYHPHSQLVQFFLSHPLYVHGKARIGQTSSRPNIACGTMIDWKWLI